MSKAHLFPDLVSQEELDANASMTLRSRWIQFTINLRNRLRRSWR